ncbi:hypothetical protein FRC07_012080 [Ceratobasidium sp. 392]|nr:hypothetical protein FRC07_012080 [Ceratobasidium sp. 392]
MTSSSENIPPTLAEPTTESKKPSKTVWKFLVPGSNDWFSEEYVARNGNLYKCRICPERGGLNPWRSRTLMGQHQRVSIIHSRLVKEAKLKKKEFRGHALSSTRPVLFYPSLSPEEPIENAIPVFYEPEELEEYTNTKKYLGTSNPPSARRGILEPLDDQSYTSSEMKSLDLQSLEDTMLWPDKDGMLTRYNK